MRSAPIPVTRVQLGPALAEAALQLSQAGVEVQPASQRLGDRRVAVHGGLLALVDPAARVVLLDVLSDHLARRTGWSEGCNPTR
jgi:hypothetical protein